MPNVREQTLSPTLVSAVCTNGATPALTKPEVQAFYQTTSGNAAQRKALVVAWIPAQFSDRSGGMLPASKIFVDIDVTTLDFSALETRE